MTGGLYLQDALRMRFVLLNSHAMQPVDVLQRFLAIWILQIGAKVEQQDQLIYGTKIFHKLVFALERRKHLRRWCWIVATAHSIDSLWNRRPSLASSTASRRAILLVMLVFDIVLLLVS